MNNPDDLAVLSVLPLWTSKVVAKEGFIDFTKLEESMLPPPPTPPRAGGGLVFDAWSGTLSFIKIMLYFAHFGNQIG